MAHPNPSRLWHSSTLWMITLRSIGSEDRAAVQLQLILKKVARAVRIPPNLYQTLANQLMIYHSWRGYRGCTAEISSEIVADHRRAESVREGPYASPLAVSQSLLGSGSSSVVSTFSSAEAIRRTRWVMRSTLLKGVLVAYPKSCCLFCNFSTLYAGPAVVIIL